MQVILMRVIKSYRFIPELSNNFHFVLSQSSSKFVLILPLITILYIFQSTFKVQSTRIKWQACKYCKLLTIQIEMISKH